MVLNETLLFSSSPSCARYGVRRRLNSVSYVLGSCNNTFPTNTACVFLQSSVQLPDVRTKWKCKILVVLRLLVSVQAW